MDNKKILLITSFEPFGGDEINSGALAVERLPEEIGNFKVVKKLLPVVFGRAANEAIAEAEKLSADAVICIGQASGRKEISLERIAKNVRNARIPDNDGNQPKDEEIISGGDREANTTLPIVKMKEAIDQASVPCAFSDDAGAYVCNDLFYSVVSRFRETGVISGFIHVPNCELQKEPFLKTEDVGRALCEAIKVM